MDKASLKHLLECMIIMSYIDGSDAEELKLIKKIFNTVWESDESGLDEILQKSAQEIEACNQATMQKRFEENARALARLWDSAHKKMATDLMMKLIKADNRITGQETDLFIKFKTFLASA